MTTSVLFTSAALLLALGLVLVLTRRNAVMALMGIELMLNASALNLAAFNRLHPDRLDGQTAALFVIVLAAAEAAVALAIVLNLYERYRSVDLGEADTLKG